MSRVPGIPLRNAGALCTEADSELEQAYGCLRPILLKNSELGRQENFGRSALQRRDQAGSPLGAAQRHQVELHFVDAGPPARPRHRRLKRFRFFAVGGPESFSTELTQSSRLVKVAKRPRLCVNAVTALGLQVCCRWTRAVYGGRASALALRLHRLDQRSGSEQPDHSLHVVGQHMQAHLSSHLR